MDWEREKDTWPNAEYSTFLSHRDHRWHVQVAGEGPTLLLLHGAFGATQSWRDVLPRLAGSFRVIAPDLPGQGFSRCGNRRRLSVSKLAADLESLGEVQGWTFDYIVGHSAGAVLGLEMISRQPARGFIGLNAALGKFDGIAGWLFPVMAKALALNPLAAPLLTRLPNHEERVRELLASTGSAFDARMIDLYTRLARDRMHVSGTIAMMAAWNVDPVWAKLGQIEVPCLFLSGENDRTVPPRISSNACARLPNATVESLVGLGHLMHEEAPKQIADIVERFAVGAGAQANSSGRADSHDLAV